MISVFKSLWRTLQCARRGHKYDHDAPPDTQIWHLATLTKFNSDEVVGFSICLDYELRCAHCGDVQMPGPSAWQLVPRHLRWGTP